MTNTVYFKVAEGVATTGAMYEQDMLVVLADGTQSLADLSEAELLAKGAARCTVAEYPLDGYLYALSTPAIVDGAWSVSWEQQPSPMRETIEAIRARTLRSDRDQAIAQTDWTQMPDVALSAEQKAAWAAYRQALRDLPSQPGFPWSVQWPAKP